MKPMEMRAAGSLATATLTDTVLHIEQVHRAIAARVFTVAATAAPPGSSMTASPPASTPGSVGPATPRAEPPPSS